MRWVGGEPRENRAEVFYGSELGVAGLLVRCVRMRVGDGIGEGDGGVGGVVGRRGGRNGAIVGEEFDGHVVTFASCGGNVDVVAAIVLAGWAEVPAVNAVRRECTSGSGRFVRHHAASRGSKWCFVEVEGPVELGFGG